MAQTPEDRAEIVRIGREKGIVAPPVVHYHADSDDLPWPGPLDADCHYGEGLASPPPPLTPFIVTLADGSEYRFMADDTEHAREQAENAEPDVLITSVTVEGER